MRYLIFVSMMALSSCGVGQRLSDGVFGKGGAKPAPMVAANSGDPAPSAPEGAPSEATDSADPAEQVGTSGADPVARLGAMATVAALGDPTRAGTWMETPLVSTPRPGRITLTATGKTAEVTLIPIAGEATSGSRLSLAGFQALGAPLTELLELTVQPL